MQAMVCCFEKFKQYFQNKSLRFGCVWYNNEYVEFCFTSEESQGFVYDTILIERFDCA